MARGVCAPSALSPIAPSGPPSLPEHDIRGWSLRLRHIALLLVRRELLASKRLLAPRIHGVDRAQDPTDHGHLEPKDVELVVGAIRAGAAHLAEDPEDTRSEEDEDPPADAG